MQVRMMPRIRGTLCQNDAMKNEFTAIIEQDEGWFIAYCPEVPGANGQGRTKVEAVRSLASAIELILEERREEVFRGVPPGSFRETVRVG
jgi:predicted RNase H-like HicB family nuclease